MCTFSDTTSTLAHSCCGNCWMLRTMLVHRLCVRLYGRSPNYRDFHNFGDFYFIKSCKHFVLQISWHTFYTLQKTSTLSGTLKQHHSSLSKVLIIQVELFLLLMLPIMFGAGSCATELAHCSANRLSYLYSHFC